MKLSLVGFVFRISLFVSFFFVCLILAIRGLVSLWLCSGTSRLGATFKLSKSESTSTCVPFEQYQKTG